MFARGRAVYLVKPVKHMLLLIQGDALPRVGHCHHPVSGVGPRKPDADCPVLSKLYRVTHQVDQDLTQPARVALQHIRQIRRQRRRYFKTFGAGKLLGDTIGYNQPLQLRPRGKLSSGGADDAQAVLPRLSVAECLHYTLTVDPDVALLGLSFPNEQDQAFAAAESFAPLPAATMADIRRRAVEARQDKGPCWWNPDPDA